MAQYIWTTSSNPTQFDADIDKWYFSSIVKWLNSPNLLHRQVGEIMNIKNPKWRAAIDALIGRWGSVAEGTEEAPVLTPRQVTTLRIVTKLVKGVLVFSREYLEDDSESNTASRVRNYVDALAQRGVLQLELDWTNTFINTAFTLNALRDQRDGVALASASHPAGVSGQTYGNTGTAAAITIPVLEQLVAYFMGSIYDDSGELTPMMVTEIDLIVHPSKWLSTKQLVESTSSTADYKNAGVKNSVNNGIKWNVIPAPYQTSLTQWSAVAHSGAETGSGLVTLMRVAPGAPEKIIRQNPDQAQYQGRMRYGLLATDPRAFYSNPGL